MNPNQSPQPPVQQQNPLVKSQFKNMMKSPEITKAKSLLGQLPI